MQSVGARLARGRGRGSSCPARGRPAAARSRGEPLGERREVRRARAARRARPAGGRAPRARRAPARARRARRREPARATRRAPCAGARSRRGRARAPPASPPGRGARARRAPSPRWAPGERPCARSRRTTLHVAGELGEHGGHAVGARARRGGEPLADLALDHRDPARHRRQFLDRAQDRRRRDPVGQVGDDLGRARDRARRGRAPARRRGAASRSGYGSSASRSAGSRRGSTSTTWTWATRCARYSDSTPRPAADLQHHVVAGQLGGAPDDLEDVGVDEEVLAQLAVGPDVELAQAPQARLDGELGAHHPKTSAALRLQRGLELLVGDAAQRRRGTRAVCTT